jgi:arylsulfatase A-like enzyme
MKIPNKILLNIFIIIMFFLLFIFYTNCSKGEPQLAYKEIQEYPQCIPQEHKENILKDVLFLNDIFPNYKSIRTNKNKPYISQSYQIDPSELKVLKGTHKWNSGILEVTGDEVVLALQGMTRMIKEKNLDLLTLNLNSNKEIDIETYEIHKRLPPEAQLNQLIPADIIKNFSKFTFMVSVNETRKFQDIDIQLANYFVKGKKRIRGLVLVLRSRDKSRVKIALKEFTLKGYNHKIASQYPSVNYFKFQKRWVKSLFVPGNCSLTYRIKAKKNFIMDGYLATFPGESVFYKIKVNGKEVCSQKISSAPRYFSTPIQPAEDTSSTLIEITTIGKDTSTGILGNLSFYYKKENPENIVFYLVDALRSDYGGIKEDLFETQFKGGSVFQNAYANAAWTGDSLPVIFTGKYKFTLVENPVFQPNLPENEFLLAEYLKSKGYTTVAFIANSFLVKNNTHQGFDLVYLCWGDNRKLSIFPEQEEYINYKYGKMKEFIHQFVEKNKHKKLFIYIHTLEPHDPYELPQAMRCYSKDKSMELLERVNGKFKVHLPNPTPAQVDTLKSLYQDDVVASFRFLQHTHTLFNSANICNKNSLFIFTSDHGERFFEHRSWVHGTPDVYNEVLRIPMILQGPGFQPGFYTPNVQLADLYPTIMDWLGDPKNSEMIGDSLLTCTRNQNPDQFKSRPIYSDGTKHPFQHSIITGNTKIIIDGNNHMVFDLSKDPSETHNLALLGRYQSLITWARNFRKSYKKSTPNTKKKNTSIRGEELQRLKSLGYLE